MQLVTSKTTPYGRMARITYQIHELQVEEVEVFVWKEREKLVGVNPLSKVPVLVLDDQTPIIDSRVIVDYLDSLGSAAGKTSLWPSDADAKVRMQSKHALWQGVLAESIEIFAADTMLEAPLPQKVIDWHLGKVEAGLAELEQHAKNGEYEVSSTLSMLDVCAVSTLGYLDFRMPDTVPFRKTCPQLATYFDSMHEQHEVLRNTAPN